MVKESTGRRWAVVLALLAFGCGDSGAEEPGAKVDRVTGCGKAEKAAEPVQ